MNSCSSILLLRESQKQKKEKSAFSLSQRSSPDRKIYKEALTKVDQSTVNFDQSMVKIKLQWPKSINGQHNFIPLGQLKSADK